MKMRQGRIVVIFRCRYCQGNYTNQRPRIYPYYRECVCESCYLTLRLRDAEEDRRQRDAYIRQTSEWEGTKHLARLHMKVQARKPDVWRDYVRLSIVRTLDSRIQALEAG